MRIGIDLWPTSCPSTVDRGIGRYTRGFVHSLLLAGKSHEFILYFRDGCAGSREFLEHRNATVRSLGPPPVLYDNNSQFDVLRDNSDHLDWLILTSPHQYHITNHGKIPRISSILYDVIPDRFPDVYLNQPELKSYAAAYDRFHKAAGKYDLILSISNSTKEDLISYRKYDPSKIVVIGCGVDRPWEPEPIWFKPKPAVNAPKPRSIREWIGDFPYILHVGGLDARKGGLELIQAFAMLPPRFRSRYRMLFAYDCNDGHRFFHQKAANLLGVAHSVIFTGKVSEQVLLDLYQHAYFMALPSKAEGIGLPLIESMACGTPVIAGDNTGQVEFVGRGGLLVEPTDVKIHDAMMTLFEDEGLRDRLSRRGLEDSGKFRWSNVAEKTLQSIEGRTTAKKSASPSKPKLAFFGLTPPTMSGITPYSLNLAEALSTHYEVTFYHDPAVSPGGFSSKLVMVPADRYDGGPRVIHQFGNSHHHAWQIDPIERHGGVVTIHDLDLDGLQSWCRRTSFPLPRSWDSTYLDFFARICSRARRVIVHDECNRSAYYPEVREVMAVIPFGVHLNRDVEEDKEATRKAFGLPSGMLFVSGGLIHPAKSPEVVLAAFAAILARFPRAHLAFVGGEIDDGSLRKMHRRLQTPNVHFTGKLDFGHFADVMSSADIAIQLRKPPTNGETSSALMDALRAGIPSIVSNVGSFASIPDDVVLKVDDGQGTVNVIDAMMQLASSEVDRARMSDKSIEWCSLRTWDKVAGLYRDQIERSVG